MGRLKELWYNHPYTNYCFNLIVNIYRKKKEFLSIIQVDAVRQTHYSIKQLVDDPPATHTMLETLTGIYTHIEIALEHVLLYLLLEI